MQIEGQNAQFLPVRCACQAEHKLVVPLFQRPLDTTHVANIQRGINGCRGLVELVIKTLTCVYDPTERVYQIVDGQHRYHALKNECAQGHHHPFTLQVVPGDLAWAHYIYQVLIQGEQQPHPEVAKQAQTMDQTTFVNAAWGYLQQLNIKRGEKRPGVDYGRLIQTYQQTGQPTTLEAFRSWIQDRNAKIRSLAETTNPPRCLANVQSGWRQQCRSSGYWFGLFKASDYATIATLT